MKKPLKFSMVKSVSTEKWVADNIKSKEIPKPIQEELKSRHEKSPIVAVPTLGMMDVKTVLSCINPKGNSALDWRRAYGSFSRAIAKEKEITISWPKSIKNENLRAALIGLQQGSYAFDRYRKFSTSDLENISLHGLSIKAKKTIEEAAILGEATHICRDLVNTPAEDMGPDQFVAFAKKIAKPCGLKVKVIAEAECKKLGMGGLLTVGRASHRRPRMLVVDWEGKSKAKKKNFLALCGKGVCFDTGGLNIKPGQSMMLMRKDMGGAATVLSTMVALARLNAPNAVRAYLPLVENSIGPDAFRPGDVMTICDGTTVENGHTDAEGRLILADAIAYAKKQGASHIVSVATLTGAAMVALGRIHVPIMGDSKLVNALKKGAKSSGEKVWELPMDEEHRGLVRGKVADLTNSDGSGEAGCITAGAFLSYFAGDVPFAHADISPGSWKAAPHALGPSGATGIMVTTLVDAFRGWK